MAVLGVDSNQCPNATIKALRVDASSIVIPQPLGTASFTLQLAGRAKVAPEDLNGYVVVTALAKIGVEVTHCENAAVASQIRHQLEGFVWAYRGAASTDASAAVGAPKWLTVLLADELDPAAARKV